MHGRFFCSPPGLKRGWIAVVFQTLKGIAVVDPDPSPPASSHCQLARPAVVLEQTLVDGVPSALFLGRANSGPDAQAIEGKPLDSLLLAPGNISVIP